MTALNTRDDNFAGVTIAFKTQASRVPGHVYRTFVRCRATIFPIKSGPEAYLDWRDSLLILRRVRWLCVRWRRVRWRRIRWRGILFQVSRNLIFFGCAWPRAGTATAQASHQRDNKGSQNPTGLGF